MTDETTAVSNDSAAKKRRAKEWMRQQGKAAAGPVTRVWLIGLAGTALAIGQAYCIAFVIGGLLGHPHDPDRAWLTAGFAVFGFLRAALNLLGEHASFAASASARRRLRTDALTRLLAAGPALLRRRHSGELAALVVDRIESLDGMFGRWLPATRLAIAGPLLVAVAVFWADPISGCIVVGAGLFVPVGMAVAGIGAATASRRQFVAMARLQARFLDRIRGIATIVMNGRAASESDSIARAADELRQRTMRVLRVAFLSSVVLDCAAAFALVVIALRDAAELADGRMASAGAALFVLLLVAEFFAPLRAYAAAYQDGFQAHGAAEALTDLPPAPEPVPEIPVRTVAARGVSVAFDNVTVIFDPARPPALEGLSFRAPAGETLVLAGPSGAGKSTILEVLLGFVRPEAGRVTINGADLSTLTPQALTRLTAWIGQRPVLFAGSIRENIRFGRPTASEEEISEAARFARVENFAAHLPQGLDTIVGEGGYGVSGGQAQRIAIARAFLKNAPLLLLDEPTAHLDPTTEGEVLDSLRRLTVGRTVILASHSAAAHAFGGRRLDLREGRALPVRGVA
jgi:ATP-binding cassette subfamily C protein CydD